ncbi:MAG: ATP synthase subunit F [Firmicutes bacterium]|nr:ATP synthase subunit F [Bacillota bacterium]
MKSFLISDNRDTQVGMRLAGITGVVVHEREDILAELNEALRNKEIGIIIITKNIMSKAHDEIMEIKLKRTFPLIVVIPDRHGFGEEGLSITKYISESVGIKI